MARNLCISAAWLSVLCVGCSGVASAQDNGAVQLEEIVVSTTPVPGAVGVDANKVPSFESRVTQHDLEVQHTPSVADAITAHVPGAIALNVDGSDLSPDLYYRGFDASRISGTSEGLAVYQNGVRINEAFGDTVNLDLVPPIAVDHSDIYTNNPIFGLNALGGAISFTMKNGFNFHGGDASILAGSYGRVNGNIEYGKQVGNYSFYGAIDGYRDGGYRPFGAQNAERAYVDLGYRTQDAEIHAIGGYGHSLLGVQGVTPQVLVDKQYNSVFTTPQTTDNQAGLAQITARVDVTPTWSLSSNVYFRKFDQVHTDGNDADVEDCGDDGDPTSAAIAGTLCLSADDTPAYPAVTAAQRQFLSNGVAIGPPHPGADIDSFAYGTTAHTITHTTTEGGQFQATNRDNFYGHDNYFVAGGSIDHSHTDFSSYTTLGELNSAFQSIESGFNGAGDQLNAAGDIGYSSTFVSSTASYYGLFALDTFNITKQFAITAGARGNVALIGLHDLSGTNPRLNSDHDYDRVNPMAGFTYEFRPELTIYGGYSEANRAPTPLESACADPNHPCVLETALVSDPKLEQPVSQTYEAGARGIVPIPEDRGSLVYKAGYFHTATNNDIVSEPSPESGQGYYVNVPETLRQGVEAGLMYNKGPWSFYGNYAYVDATYQFDAAFSSPNSPAADADGNIQVKYGDHIPGIPRNIGKLGFEYQVTPAFIVGMDAVLVGSQYFVGDDSNQNPQLPFYYFLNAHASYQVTDRIQVFGLIKNLTNNHYASYGTYYDTGTDGGLVNATLAANNGGNPDAVTVAQPLSFYGGVKVNF